MLSSGKTQFNLQLTLKEADLLALLSKHTIGRAPHARNTEARSSKDPVTAYLSLADDGVHLDAELSGHHPVQLLLRKGSRSYYNFVDLALGEVKHLSNESELHFSSASDALIKIEQNLEQILQSSDGQTRHSDKASPTDKPFCTVDLFGIDFEPASTLLKSTVNRTNSVRSSEFELEKSPASRELPLLKARNGTKSAAKSARNIRKPRRETRIRLFEDDDQQAPQFISGFLSLDLGENRGSIAGQQPTENSVSNLLASFSFADAIRVEVQGRMIEAETTIRVPAEYLSRFKLFARWGSIAGGVWQDEEISSATIQPLGEDLFRVQVGFDVFEPGTFGLTFWAAVKNTDFRIWYGRPQTDDAIFTVEDLPKLRHVRRHLESSEELQIKSTLLASLASYDKFVRTVNRVHRTVSAREISRMLYELTRHEDELRESISEYYANAVEQLAVTTTEPELARLQSVTSVLQTIGVEEIILVSPEGPHAVAGGLAQVVVGLMNSLGKAGTHVTLITPIYESAQGNKHTDAESLIRNGIRLGGNVVPLTELGEIRIPFGPTYHSGSTQIRQAPYRIAVRVYEARGEDSRVIFLRHAELAERLYPQVPSDELLKKAIFLSRGALEVIADETFQVAGKVVLSNDWLSALVPVFAQTDDRYVNDSRLRNLQTIHVLHNCGRSYQGRVRTNQFGEDIFPLLGISPDHYFGVSDPSEVSFLNMTAGAIYHVRKALLTVSRPYAEQLLTPQGGEGLESLFQKRRDVLFGISNGIDLQALRRIFWRLGERAESALADSLAGLTATSGDLPRIKQLTKLVLQKKYGLEVAQQKILISFVGRLAEQKGIQLFTDQVLGTDGSLLESVLKNYPEVQFVIGGPPTEGEQAFEVLRTTVTALQEKYPKRIIGIFEFIPHEHALEITGASDFFLMPSRYEPGGITQLEALATGTLVVAREVGGIIATLSNYQDAHNQGNSFLFQDYNATALYRVIARALSVVRDEKKRLELIHLAASAENDWTHRTSRYLALFQMAAGVIGNGQGYSHLRSQEYMLNSIRPKCA